MTYSVWLLIAEDPDGDKISLTFDSESSARNRYNALAKLGKAELLRIVRNPEAVYAGAF